MSASSEPLILWAEDDDADVLLLRLAFKKSSLPDKVVHVRDGHEAIRYLIGEGRYSDRNRFPLPSLLLLDIKMPGKNGFDVLEWKQSQPILRDLPAVMFSSSDIESDREAARKLGARAYLVKPTQLDEMRGIAQMLISLQERVQGD